MGYLYVYVVACFHVTASNEFKIEIKKRTELQKEKSIFGAYFLNLHSIHTGTGRTCGQNI